MQKMHVDAMLNKTLLDIYIHKATTRAYYTYRVGRKHGVDYCANVV